MRPLPFACLTAVVVVLTGSTGPARADEKDDMDVQKRVRELLAVIADPDARSKKLQQSIAAQAELLKIGVPATPQLVAAIVESPRASVIGHVSARLLMEIGKPALPAVAGRWSNLNDYQRWRLMPFREKYDLDAVREYVWSCLASDDEVIRGRAWSFNHRHPDPRAKERFFNALHGKDRSQGGEDDSMRWWLIPDKPVYDDKAEVEILIGLLKPDGWAAKGKGAYEYHGPYAPPWTGDGRPHIIDALRARKVTRAAPELLKVLQELGEGTGHLVEQIAPVLIEFKYKEAIPELEKIAVSKELFQPKRIGIGDPFKAHDDNAVRKLAADAAKKLREVK